MARKVKIETGVGCRLFLNQRSNRDCTPLKAKAIISRCLVADAVCLEYREGSTIGKDIDISACNWHEVMVNSLIIRG